MKRYYLALVCCMLLTSSVSAFAHDHGRHFGYQPGNPSISINGDGWSLSFGNPVIPFQPIYQQPPQIFYDPPPPVYVAPRRLIRVCTNTYMGQLPNGLPLVQQNCWHEWR